jgi:RimJ/RimL family protein N-acetyltransferase
VTGSEHIAAPTVNVSDEVTVREIREDDAASLLALQHRLDEETAMMMLEPGERSSSIDIVRAHIRETIGAANSTIIVAASESGLVGYVGAVGGRYRRTRHRAEVVIGVLHSHQGRGIGGALLAGLRSWAADHGVRRLELTVRTDNHPAQRLYEKAGFAVEGVRRNSLRVGEAMIDELEMAVVLHDEEPRMTAPGELSVRALRSDERPGSRNN